MMKLGKLDCVLVNYVRILELEAAGRDRLSSWGEDPYAEISSAMSLRAEVLDRLAKGVEEI